MLVDVGLHDVVALERHVRLPVERQAHVHVHELIGLREHFDLHLVIAGNDDGLLAERMRVDGREDAGSETRVHDGTAGSERIGRGTRRSRQDQPVCAEGGEFFAVDGRAQVDEARDAALRDDRFVHHKPLMQLLFATQGRHVKNAPFLDDSSALQEIGDQVRCFVQIHLRQKPDIAAIDAEDRHRKIPELAYGS